jgi:enamine deaminase RidA (YjgF/YER057c/UK114 family)
MPSEIIRHKPGQRFSQAVVHGDTIYLAGQTGDPSHGIREQTQEVLAKIDALLSELGSSRTRILSATVWLTDPRHFNDMNSVWEAWISGPPVRATVGSPLMQTGLLVEISVIAAR